MGSKWVMTNIKSETIKLQKTKQKQEKLHNIGLGNDLMDEISKPQATKPKPHKWDYSKLKYFCIAKQATQ